MTSFDRTTFFLSIAGNIGVGKTTLTLQISQRLGLQPFYEKVIKNPYLDDFYSDMTRWSFNLQIYFLSHRFMDQRKMIESPHPCVQDRTIYEDAEIFAYILHQQGYMSERDYQNYRELFYAMTDYLKKPDLIVYLKASTWTLLSRIRKRGRDFEKNISIEYLYELNKAYDRWIQKAEKTFNVLTIDADKYDFHKDGEHLEHILNDIKLSIGAEACRQLGMA